MSEHVTRLSKVITENFKDSQNRQAEAMEAVLQHYSEAITKNFASQFENMAQVIKDTTQAQVEIKQQLINFTQQLESQFEAQSALIEKTNRAGEILGQSLRKPGIDCAKTEKFCRRHHQCSPNAGRICHKCQRRAGIFA